MYSIGTPESHNYAEGTAEIVSHCIENKQMASASSYIFCPHPECDWSAKKPSIVWFGSTSVNIGRVE